MRYFALGHHSVRTYLTPPCFLRPALSAHGWNQSFSTEIRAPHDRSVFFIPNFPLGARVAARHGRAACRRAGQAGGAGEVSPATTSRHGAPERRGELVSSDPGWQRLAAATERLVLLEHPAHPRGRRAQERFRLRAGGG